MRELVMGLRSIALFCNDVFTGLRLPTEVRTAPRVDLPLHLALSQADARF